MYVYITIHYNANSHCMSRIELMTVSHIKSTKMNI